MLPRLKEGMGQRRKRFGRTKKTFEKGEWVGLVDQNICRDFEKKVATLAPLNHKKGVRKGRRRKGSEH